eukprot:5557961-Amphidinium_carterae.1
MLRCWNIVLRGTCFVRRLLGLCTPLHFLILNNSLCTADCDHNVGTSRCLTLPPPLRAAIPLAAAES